MIGFLKALARFIAPRSSWSLSSRLPRSSFNNQATVGKGFRSSVVMAPVHWIARNFPQAVLTVEMDGEPVADHELTQLVNRPNGFYGGVALWMSTIFSYVLSGNAYWLIVRDERTMRPLELWYAPHWMVTPVQGDDGADFIMRYDYRPRGQKIALDPQDVIHFRYGLDPENIALGISPLASLWREIFTDDEAANFTAALLNNMGMAGIVISPAKGVNAGPEELETTRQYINERLTGDRRGKPLVMGAGTEVGQMAFSPQQLTLGALRDIPEERVREMKMDSYGYAALCRARYPGGRGGIRHRPAANQGRGDHAGVDSIGLDRKSDLNGKHIFVGIGASAAARV